MGSNPLPNDWWPDALRPIVSETPLASEHVVVAEIGRPWGDRSYRQIYTALVPPEIFHALLSTPGGIGHEVQATGPHTMIKSSSDERRYKPNFYIDASGIVPHGLEPLAIAWTSANRSYIAPDQGFLMTYGLIPRLVTSKSRDEIHWDDPSVPRSDVVVSVPVSTYDFPTITLAQVTVHRDYLQDYATIRGLHLVQVYFAEIWQDPPSDMEAVILSHGNGDIVFPGRLIRLYEQDNPRSYLAQVWGTRPLIGPAISPIKNGRWQYGELIWPGIDGIVTYDRAMTMKLNLEVAFVLDSVLEKFEARPQFSIHPESGGVAYGNQWSVGNTQRICRDYIAIELKKLYEGTPPEVVHHYHLHAVPPPSGDLDKLRTHPNVATRTRRIAYALAKLGEELATLSSIATGRKLTSKDTVGLSREKMDYEGWWLNPQAEPVSRHAPPNMTCEQFLSRCGLLDQMVIEALKESLLRETLIKLGVDQQDIVTLRSLMLLVRILNLANIAAQAHLRVVEDTTEILIREEEARAQGYAVIDLPILRNLHELRIMRSHKTEKSRTGKMSNALAGIGVDQRSTAAGWGIVLDALYDGVASELEGACSILQRALCYQS